ITKLRPDLHLIRSSIRREFAPININICLLCIQEGTPKRKQKKHQHKKSYKRYFFKHISSPEWCMRLVFLIEGIDSNSVGILTLLQRRTQISVREENANLFYIFFVEILLIWGNTGKNMLTSAH